LAGEHVGKHTTLPTTISKLAIAETTLYCTALSMC